MLHRLSDTPCGNSGGTALSRTVIWVLATVHVAAGVLVGVAVAKSFPQRPPLVVAGVALAVAAGSHLLLDAVPHWQVATSQEGYLAVAKVDGLVAAAVCLFATVLAPAGLRLCVLLGSLGGILLDMDKPMAYFFAADVWPQWLDLVHHGIQRESASLFWVDALFLALSVLLTLWLFARIPDHRALRPRLRRKGRAAASSESAYANAL